MSHTCSTRSYMIRRVILQILEHQPLSSMSPVSIYPSSHHAIYCTYDCWDQQQSYPTWRGLPYLYLAQSSHSFHELREDLFQKLLLQAFHYYTCVFKQCTRLLKGSLFFLSPISFQFVSPEANTMPNTHSTQVIYSFIHSLSASHSLIQ